VVSSKESGKISRREGIRLLITAALVSIPSSAFGNTRPPKPCKKVGEVVIHKGKKFTCVKVNKKLVWDKGVPIKEALPTKSAAPTTSQSPSPNPSATSNSTASARPTATISSSPQAPVKVLFAKSQDVARESTVVINGKDQYGRPLSVAFTRSKTSLIALDASCTHAGCIVRPEGKELSCPCHYSIFDPESGKPGNPSQQGAYPLSRLEVLEESGSIYLLLN
jgi:nitrite reductase/ring-hydroxylating ferredoxin subunit